MPHLNYKKAYKLRKYNNNSFKRYYRKANKHYKKLLRGGAQKLHRDRSYNTKRIYVRGKPLLAWTRLNTRNGGYYNRFQRKKSYEKKFLDTTLEKTITFNDDWTKLTSVDQTIAFVPRGTGPSERIGRKIYIHNIDYDIIVQNTSATQGASVGLKFVLDKQCNGANAAESAIFENSEKLYSPLNMENSNRFVTLKNLSCTLSKVGDNNCGHRFKGRLNFKKPILINYDDTNPGTNVNNMQSNNILILHGAKGYGGVEFSGGINSIIRIRYTD